MSHFKSLTTLSILTFTCLAMYASTPSDELVSVKSLKSDKEEASQKAVLAIITNLILSSPRANTPATFDGDTTGEVTEDTTLTTTGTLDVTDPDENQEAMQAGTYNGTFGSILMDAEGEWRYTLDNTNATVQALDDGETVTDLVTVRSLDGTAKIITLTVNGKNEVAIDTLPTYNVTIIDLGPDSALNMEITDVNNGVSKVVISYDSGTTTQTYTSGIISTGAEMKGTKATVVVTDGDGNVAPAKVFTF